MARRHGIGYFVAKKPEADSAGGPVQSFLRDFTVLEMAAGELGAFRLRDDKRLTSEVLLNNDFRDGLSGWSMHGKVGYARTPPEVTVTLHDTLAQSFSVRSGVEYRYSVAARCGDGRGSLLLQVNWYSARGKFLGTLLVPRPCEAALSTFAVDFVPPADAAVGVVVVGGHGDDRVIIRSVSLRL